MSLPSFPELPLSAAPSPVLACKTALDGMLATAALALTFVQAGRSVDLGGLDVTAGRICAQALDLPPNEGAVLHADMRRLAIRLDALAEAMRAQL